MADSPYVHDNICAGICDGSRLVRGDMSFYLLQGPTDSRTSVIPWTPIVINDYTFSLVFWVEVPERNLYPPFFNVWIAARGPNDRVATDFRTFRRDRNDDSKWQVAVSLCSLIYLNGSQTYGLGVTSRTFVDDPYQGLSVLGFLPGSRALDALSYVGQKLTLNGVNEDTVGIPIRRPLDNVGEIDLQLRDATYYSDLSDGETSAYVICLTFYQIPDES
jgi:hypothetical protein